MCSFPRLVPKINILSRCNLVPERHGRMAPCANGLAAFGGGLPPSRATREQDAAGAGALNCFHHQVGRRKIAGCRQGFSRCASITSEPAAVPDSAAIEMLRRSLDIASPHFMFTSVGAEAILSRLRK